MGNIAANAGKGRGKRACYEGVTLAVKGRRGRELGKREGANGERVEAVSPAKNGGKTEPFGKGVLKNEWSRGCYTGGRMGQVNKVENQSMSIGNSAEQKRQ